MEEKSKQKKKLTKTAKVEKVKTKIGQEFFMLQKVSKG